MKRKIVTIILAGAFTVASCMTAFAGWEQTGTQWRYQNTDNIYLSNTWAWLDGNNDSVAECYCFDENGNLYVNTTTPDQYIVNENGAWIVNGIVQTKVISGDSGTQNNGMIPGTNLPSTGNSETDPPSVSTGGEGSQTFPADSPFMYIPGNGTGGGGNIGDLITN